MDLVSKIRSIYFNYDDPVWRHDRVCNRIAKPYYSLRENNGISVMKKDWDNLLILDACRADVFEKVASKDIFDFYQTVTSRGSRTVEWIEQNFGDKNFGDTVYVTANPYVTSRCPQSFHAIFDAWSEHYDVSNQRLRNANGLSDVGDTDNMITASQVNETAYKANNQYPNKRLIIHYVQPHAPYLGLPNGSERSVEERPRVHPKLVLSQDVTQEELEGYYRDNLQYVLNHVTDILNKLPGKSVVSSDHGELLGERLRPVPIRGYAHPRGIRHPSLIRVPWAVYNNGARKKILDEGTSNKSVENVNVEKQLELLGYQ